MDKRDGHGRATFVSGLEYEGAWMDDKTHGYVMASTLGSGSVLLPSDASMPVQCLQNCQ